MNAPSECVLNKLISVADCKTQDISMLYIKIDHKTHPVVLSGLAIKIYNPSIHKLLTERLEFNHINVKVRVLHHFTALHGCEVHPASRQRSRLAVERMGRCGDDCGRKRR